MGRYGLMSILVAFTLIFSFVASPASATHHGTDSTYPTAKTNYVDFSTNVSCGPNGDIDGDYICDSWETPTGLQIDTDGVTPPEYTYLCNPSIPNDCPGTDMRDIYLELDWMNWHEPSSGVLDLVKQAFLNAPAASGGTPGIRLHIQNGEDPSNPTWSQQGLIKINGSPFHVNSMKFYTATATNDGFYKIKENFFGTISERALDTSAPSTPLTAKRQVFHYAIIGHKQTEYPSSSGIAEIMGNDLFVTLGSFGTPTTPPYEIGSVDQQAATLMHELGHNLNLRHGGGQDANCKPNYISIMNYRLQFQDTFDPSRPYDFSRTALRPLDENHLNEDLGVGSYISSDSSTERKFSYSSSSPYWDMTSGTPPADDVNWNGGTISTDVGANIDNFSGCANTALSTNLTGYDDWNNLILDVSQTTNSNFGNGLPSASYSGEKCLGRISEDGDTNSDQIPDIPCDVMRGVDKQSTDQDPINEASSGGAEMTIDIDRDYRHLNLLQVGNLIGNLSKNDTSDLDSTKQSLKSFLASAMEDNSRDDLEKVSNNLGQLRQAAKVLVFDGEKKSSLLDTVDKKIEAFAAAQYIGDHALPPAEHVIGNDELKKDITNLNDKVDTLNSKTDDLADKVTNLEGKGSSISDDIKKLEDKTDGLSGDIKNIGDKISRISNNDSLVYLILIVIGLTIAILIVVLVSRSRGPRPAPQGESTFQETGPR